MVWNIPNSAPTNGNKIHTQLLILTLHKSFSEDSVKVVCYEGFLQNMFFIVGGDSLEGQLVNLIYLRTYIYSRLQVHRGDVLEPRLHARLAFIRWSSMNKQGHSCNRTRLDSGDSQWQRG